MTLLDIGGGFPGDAHSTPTFEDIASALRPYLDEYFPDTRLIAEPGRFFACSTHTLVCNVFSKRLIDIPEEDKKHGLDHVVRASKPNAAGSVEFQYYINDGVYQSFNCLFFDHVHIGPENVKLLDPRPTNVERHLSTIFGPTCDALDCILKRAKLPEIQTGEWIFFSDFGAYTVAAASRFNGFGTAKYHYICSVDIGGECSATEAKRRKLA
jgi:ornithine decarboxylase